MLKFGKLISADGDNFVRYAKYDKDFVVVKGLYTGYTDSYDLYMQEMKYQVLLSEKGFAPKLIRKDIRTLKDKRKFVMWVSEDAGLPIEEEDVPSANKLLDDLYDMGIILDPYLCQQLFVKGFDNKIRVTDFKNTETYSGKHNRKYIQWKA